MMHFVKTGRALAAAVLCGIGLLTGPLSIHPASAGLITCDTDPQVYLSNGRTVTLSAHISTDISTVTQVAYDLHVPNGVSVVGVSYDSYGYLETLTVESDRNGHHYSSSITVSTMTGSAVPVTAHMDLSGQRSADVDGMSGQSIWVSM